MFPNPVNYVYTNTQVESLDDLKGLSVRSPSGGIAEVLGALGCNVISMAPNDILRQSFQKQHPRLCPGAHWRSGLQPG